MEKLKNFYSEHPYIHCPGFYHEHFTLYPLSRDPPFFHPLIHLIFLDVLQSNLQTVSHFFLSTVLQNKHVNYAG